MNLENVLNDNKILANGSIDSGMDADTSSTKRSDNLYSKLTSAFSSLGRNAGTIAKKAAIATVTTIGAAILGYSLLFSPSTANARERYCRPKILNATKCVNVDQRNNPGYCHSNVTVKVCDDENFSLHLDKKVTDVKGVTIIRDKKGLNGSDLYLVKIEPRNHGYGENIFKIAYLLKNKEGEVVSRFPVDKTASKEVKLKIKKVNPKLIVNPTLQYQRMIANSGDINNQLRAFPEYDLSIKMGLPFVNQLNPVMIAGMSGNEDFSSYQFTVGAGLEARGVFRTVPIGFTFLLDFINDHNFTDILSMRFKLYGDEISGNLFDNDQILDFSYRAELLFDYNLVENKTEGIGIRAEISSFFSPGRIHVKGAEFDLLGVSLGGQYYHGPKADSNIHGFFNRENSVIMDVGMPLKVQIRSADDLNIYLKPSFVMAVGMSEGNLEGNEFLPKYDQIPFYGFLTTLKLEY
ncbi:hypothetical protein HN695_07895 [Candidatus Woesearchaeota archaeon]|jgi:hypothetical protein|nr:hypothetical protein [Candidatus Woesearchaeota archaeon]MBT5272463.1 hypothetical protein [Candidatus Woesearchaeota archaeon]MBT6041529.1 hypothetical protein [Candidatus Woesearchaeota archaeon]MBT6336325.1 hypothetical protein [Candidatus Woesearchaeota archaeon]MBT7928227.1 hypothetical protein [Candidatus Woesearchaeota archaeon]